ncbi:GIY-YIG nuclease family protein [Vibrio vulnificus]|nr:GIY-YIG nuclease family protein [Vibrio vulnificus]
MTSRTVEERARELNSTGVPTPFNIECYANTSDAALVEAWMHEGLKQFRVTKSREYFKITLEQALEQLEYLIQFCAHHDSRTTISIEYESILCSEILYGKRGKILQNSEISWNARKLCECYQKKAKQSDDSLVACYFEILSMFYASQCLEPEKECSIIINEIVSNKKNHLYSEFLKNKTSGEYYQVTLRSYLCSLILTKSNVSRSLSEEKLKALYQKKWQWYREVLYFDLVSYRKANGGFWVRLFG